MKKLLLFVSPFLFLSCKYEKVSKVPIITVTSPSENQHFVRGDVIHIVGEITDRYGLQEVGIHMTDIPTDNEFYHNHQPGDNKTTYPFSVDYTVTDNIHTSYKVEFEANNNDGGSTLKEIVITLN